MGLEFFIIDDGYEILLNPDELYVVPPMCKQYGHELCHVMIGYDRCKEHNHLCRLRKAYANSHLSSS